MTLAVGDMFNLIYVTEAGQFVTEVACDRQHEADAICSLDNV